MGQASDLPDNYPFQQEIEIMSNETTYNFFGLNSVLEAVKVLKYVHFRYGPRNATPARPYVASLVVNSIHDKVVKDFFNREGIRFSVDD